VTRLLDKNILTPLGWDTTPSQDYPPASNYCYPFISLSGGSTLSQVSFLRTRQWHQPEGLITDWSIQRQAHIHLVLAYDMLTKCWVLRPTMKFNTGWRVWLTASYLFPTPVSCILYKAPFYISAWYFSLTGLVTWSLDVDFLQEWTCAAIS